MNVAVSGIGCHDYTLFVTSPVLAYLAALASGLSAAVRAVEWGPPCRY